MFLLQNAKPSDCPPLLQAEDWKFTLWIIETKSLEFGTQAQRGKGWGLSAAYSAIREIKSNRTTESDTPPLSLFSC